MQRYTRSALVNAIKALNSSDPTYFELIRVANERAAAGEEAYKAAILLQEAGCFSIVLEKIPSALATEVSQSLDIPVIGIGAGSGCDGQVLVMHDLLGINNQFNPRFLRKYLNLYDDIKGAVESYIKDVKNVDFQSVSRQKNGAYVRVQRAWKKAKT